MSLVIPQTFIGSCRRLLSKKLPKELQGRLFVPDDHFYEEYLQEKNKVYALEDIAKKIATWLDIRIENCTFDFFRPRQIGPPISYDTAGLYFEKPETILIHEKYKHDPLSLGAILAHEMMHLYLFRNNIVLPDSHENELLTDLASIEMGLGLLVLNGFQRVNHWWISAIGILGGWFISGVKTSGFGYIKDIHYADLVGNYIRKKKITENRFHGAITPRAVRLLKRSLPISKPITKNRFLQGKQRSHRIYTLVQLLVIAITFLALYRTGVLGALWERMTGKDCDLPLYILAQEIQKKDDELSNMSHPFDTKIIERLRQERQELFQKYENLQNECGIKPTPKNLNL